MPETTPEWYDQPPYSETIDQAGTTVTRSVQTSWDERKNFPRYMLGDVKDDGVSLLTRTLPQKHPDYDWLWAAEVHLKNGAGAFKVDDQGLIYYYDSNTGSETGGKAQWEITYRPRPYVLTENAQTELDRFVVRETTLNLESQAVPGSGFCWKKDLPNKINKIPEHISIQRTIIARRYHWVWVPDSRVQNVLEAVLPRVCGRLNKTKFDGKFEPGTLLCVAPQIDRIEYTPGGTPVRTITFNFLQRVDHSWNHFYRRNSGFEEITGVPKMGGKEDPRGKETTPPFDTAEFLDLFKVPGPNAP